MAKDNPLSFTDVFNPLMTGIQSTSGLITGIIDAVQRKRERQDQLDIYNQSVLRQDRENQLMREREDNAIQRQAVDMKAAGINPLLAGNLGGASASAGGVMSMPSLPSAAVGGDIAAALTPLTQLDLQDIRQKAGNYQEWLKDVDIRKSDRNIALSTVRKIEAETKMIEREALAKGQDFYTQDVKNILEKTQAEITNLQTANLDKKAIAAAVVGSMELLLPLASKFMSKSTYDSIVDSLGKKAAYIFGNESYNATDITTNLKSRYQGNNVDESQEINNWFLRFIWTHFFGKK